MSGFGTYGDLSRFVGTNRPDLSGLPAWLQAQLQDEVRVDEGGTQTHNYNFNENPFGGFKGQDGKQYVQVGQNKLKDPKAFTTDAGLGDITSADNVIDLSPQGPNYWMIAAALSAGALGTMAGVGAAADAGVGAVGEGALGAGAGGAGGVAGGAGGAGGGLTTMNTGLSGLFAGEPALAPALANGGWEAALAGAGNFGPEAGGLLGGAGGGSSGGLLGGDGALTGGDLPYGTEMPNTYAPGANPTAFSPTAPLASQPWYQQALQGLLNNPQNAARLGMGLYSMVNANQGNVGGNPAGGADPNSIANAMGMQQFNPLQAAGQFQQNPYLLQQMHNVPFMGGSYGLGF